MLGRKGGVQMREWLLGAVTGTGVGRLPNGRVRLRQLPGAVIGLHGVQEGWGLVWHRAR